MGWARRLANRRAGDLDAPAWGWIHLLLGVLVVCAGAALWVGKVWGGMVAIALATLSAIANFFAIPYYLFWSLLVMTICIWALTRPEAFGQSA